MGAGRRENIGYTFVPDGSGALVRYEDIDATSFTLTNRIYGPDFSFRRIGGGNHTKRWRLPVFGAVEEFEIERITTPQNAYFDEEGNRRTAAQGPVTVSETVTVIDEEGNSTLATETHNVYYDERGQEIPEPIVIFVDGLGNEFDEDSRPAETEWRRDGFVAIIEEGDALAEISTDHGGNLHKFNTVFSQFAPRPTDEFNLDFDTTGINSLITISSRRKYTGNYIIRYVMLSSDEDGNPKNPGGYEATYVGMAKAYRDYLVERGELTPMAQDGSDIPLFIEALGTIRTAEYFFGMPYIGSTALTTFDDLKLMIDEFNENNITNIKFRLNGWKNQGMRGTAPARIRIERAMGGRTGIIEAAEYARQRGAVIYPDVDFAMAWMFRPFDGINHRHDRARYLDQLYAREQNYCFICQETEPWRSHAVLASERMDNMYNRAMRVYDDLEIGAMSVGSLAREVHSNHWRRSMVSRTEARENILNLFDRIQDDHGNLLAVEANAYSFRYLDSIVEVDLDGSRFMNQSESVPFYGMVTHGFINIAGEPINMSGDMAYDVLKAVESGASPYFVLAYQNANRLKEAAQWDLNKYFSVDYQVWLPDVLRIYHKLNEALSPVRGRPIVGHEFLERNVVQVTYEGGISFILNYNHFDEITVQGHTIAPLDFARVN
jgi:hypothetical protein